MNRKFAQYTKVPVERSRGEIETTLKRYGAVAFAYATKPGAALIEFAAHNRRVRFSLPLPTEKEIRSAEKCAAEERRRWRALVQAVKSKLETVASGIATFEEEFLPYTVDPQTGRTVAEAALPAIAQAYEARPNYHIEDRSV